jgi:hypothetical protein
MHEDYLQRIWSQSRIPSPNLHLTNGTPLTVKFPGKHNQSFSGPDFFEACVRFEQLEFHGAIEIHVNGSDWYKHKHHEDDAYNNVILHVVYNNDVQVVQNGFELPTLELKSYIDLEHFEKFLNSEHSDGNLPCLSGIHELDPIFLESMKTKALIQKLSNKMEFNSELDEVEIIYQLIAATFGMGINKPSFIQLAKSLPWSELKHLDPIKRMHLIFVTSGFAQGDFSKKFGQEYQWHFKGTRPGNFPTVRIPQFARFVAHIDLSKLIRIAESDQVIVQFNNYCNQLCYQTEGLKLSKSMRELLIVNTLVPLLWWKSEQSRNEIYFEKAIAVMQVLPSEQNAVVRAWKSNGVHAKNAFDSQGLIALNRYYCSLKKCLSCEVGLKILNREL